MPFSDAQKIAAFDALCPELSAKDETLLRLGIMAEVNHAECEALARRGLMTRIVGSGWATTSRAHVGLMLLETARKAKTENPKSETQNPEDRLASMVEIRPVGNVQQKIPGKIAEMQNSGQVREPASANPIRPDLPGEIPLGECEECGAKRPGCGWTDDKRDLCMDCFRAVQGGHK